MGAQGNGYRNIVRAVIREVAVQNWLNLKRNKELSFSKMKKETLVDALDRAIEECTELIHACVKKKRYPKKYVHDGRILDEKIRNEMADVIAAIFIIKNLLGLDTKQIDKRIDEKLKRWGDPESNIIPLPSAGELIEKYRKRRK
jgi:NTP pyrophosphatase (non-canonical NTP hydrolase)